MMIPYTSARLIFNFYSQKLDGIKTSARATRARLQNKNTAAKKAHKAAQTNGTCVIKTYTWRTACFHNAPPTEYDHMRYCSRVAPTNPYASADTPPKRVCNVSRTRPLIWLGIALFDSSAECMRAHRTYIQYSSSTTPSSPPVPHIKAANSSIPKTENGQPRKPGEAFFTTERPTCRRVPAPLRRA